MIDWHNIDTVLLDMDGTLLDLHFDNYFWLEYLPKRYAIHHGICPHQAAISLHKHFNQKRGTLEWYCLDYWSKQLSIDIPRLKNEINHLIQERPFAQEFLKALGEHNIQRILITNAHQQSLALKLAITDIGQYLDQIITSHDYRVPKERQEFWQRLRAETHFDPERTLFIDDTVTILKTAANFGIRHLLCISQPDSKKPAIEISEFAAIRHFSELLPLSGLQ